MVSPEDKHFTLHNAALQHAGVDTWRYQDVNDAYLAGEKNAGKAREHYQDMLTRINMCGLRIKKVTDLDSTILYPFENMPCDLWSFEGKDPDHKTFFCSTKNTEYKIKIFENGKIDFTGKISPHCYEYTGSINKKEFSAIMIVNEGCQLPIQVHRTFFKEWASTISQSQGDNPFNQACNACNAAPDDPKEHDADLPCFLLRLALDPIYSSTESKGAQTRACTLILDKYHSLNCSTFKFLSSSTIRRYLNHGEYLLVKGYEPNISGSQSFKKISGLSVKSACLLLRVFLLDDNFDQATVQETIFNTFHSHKALISDIEVIRCLRIGDNHLKERII